MMPSLWSKIAEKVLPPDGVKKVPGGVELILKNPLKTLTIRDFKIAKIAQYADVFINGIPLTPDHFRDMIVTLNEKTMRLEDLEKIDQVTIPKTPHSYLFLPIPAEPGNKLIFKFVIRWKKGLNIELTRTVVA